MTTGPLRPTVKHDRPFRVAHPPAGAQGPFSVDLPFTQYSVTGSNMRIADLFNSSRAGAKSGSAKMTANGNRKWSPTKC